MGEVVLVRHGQANSFAKTEEDYDKLSELGHKQARWLGEWMKEHDASFDVVMSGTLRRQVETLENIGYKGATQDARLNEIAYYDLTAEMKEVYGIDRVSPDEFITHFPKTLQAWKDGKLKGQETWEAFNERISDVIEMAQQPGKRVLCVTSGGVIATAISQMLGLDIPRLTQIAFPILNTSIHRIHVTEHGPMLATFNSTPHLDYADRVEDRTTY